MPRLKLWGWNKKERTRLRYIKPGDIFCFRFNDQIYCFGRIISKTLVGHISEIFDYISPLPEITEKKLGEVQRLVDLVVLDSYGLFEKKSTGEWRIIGYQEDYVPSNISNIYFTYGVGRSCKRVDVMGNETPIDESEQSNYPILTSRRDDYIKKLVATKLHVEPNLSKEDKKDSSDEKLTPFILNESINGMSLLLNIGNYKNIVFKKERRSGNGYDWTSLAKLFLGEKMPEVIDDIQFDSEADMFCAYSDNKKAIKEFAIAFHKMCEDEEVMQDLLSRTKVD